MDRLAGGLADELCDRLTAGLEVSPGKMVGVGEALTAGENEDDGLAEGVDPAQAETAAEASMAMAPQPATANLAPVPVLAMVARIFMDPPHAPRGGGVFRSSTGT